jgi:serine/threonine protein kinase
MQDGVDKVDLFIETLINIFMTAVTENNVNQFISSPNVITMGTFNNFSISPGDSSSFTKKINRNNSSNQLILVQEKLDGITFKNLRNDENLLIQALKQLCRGLKILQNDYSFAHKDFHGENVMYNTDDERVYIIDFGYSCFSIPDTPGSIQSLEGGYGINQLDDDYREHIPCMNKSSDLCTLLLSLIWFGAEYPWLIHIGEDICARYTSEYDKKSDGWEYMNDRISKIKKRGKFWNWTSPIFHFWYIYEMFEIDVGFGPDQLLKLLEEKFPSSTDSTQITYPKLKF